METARRDEDVIERAQETAAFHMVSRIPKATADTPVAAVVEELRGRYFDCADCIFCDG